MRILHVTTSLAPRGGGPSKVAVEMCEALAGKGVEVVLFSTNLDGRGQWSPFASPATMDVPTDHSLFINDVERRSFAVKWPSRFVFAPAMERELRRRISEFDVVEVHSLYAFTTLATCYHAYRRHVPYVVRPHGTLDPYLRERHAFRKAIVNIAAQHRLLDRAAAIHYTSEEERELARPLGIKARGVVSGLGVNPGDYEDLPPRGAFRDLHPGLQNRRLVVFLGRMHPVKGLDLLIQAFGLVAKEMSDVHLVLAGPDDEGFGDKVRAWLKEFGLASRATMTGMLVGQEKLALLADTDVWVLPSYTENFAVSAVEAMACGLPIILTDRVKIHKEVSSATAGLIVTCDPRELAAAMKRVLSDSELGRRLGMAARQLTRERFTWDVATNRLLEIYENVVKGSADRKTVRLFDS